METPANTPEYNPAETGDPVDENPQESASWFARIKKSQRRYEDYFKACDVVDSRYASLKRLSPTLRPSTYSIFWANIEVIKNSIYSRPPQPAVTQRFRQEDDQAREAAEILERALTNAIDLFKAKSALMLARDDLVRNARGIVWITGRPETAQINVQHVRQVDFALEEATHWDAVTWVARRVYLTHAQMQARFGETNPNWIQAKFSHHPGDDASNRPFSERQERQTLEKRAEVWEIWDRTDRLVVWVTEGVDTLLDVQPPPYELEGFFPCPRPAFDTLEPNTLLPVPDYFQYKDQLDDIDLNTAKISALQKAVKLRFLYASDSTGLREAVEQAFGSDTSELQGIPVNASLFEGRTLQEALYYLPIADVVATIQSMIQTRAQMIDDLFQISGISDIMRGDTAASETLGAQRLKSQYGSIRMRTKQVAMEKLARDVVVIMGEIISESFTPDAIWELSQYRELPREAELQQQIMAIDNQIRAAAVSPELVVAMTNDPEGTYAAGQKALAEAEAMKEQLRAAPSFEKAVSLLRDSEGRPMIIDIETESTIEPDEFKQREESAELLTTVTTAMQALYPMVQGAPQTAALAGKLLKIALKPYRQARPLEDEIDKLIESMTQQASAPPQPSPEQITELENTQADTASKQAEATKRQQEAIGQLLENQRIATGEILQ